LHIFSMKDFKYLIVTDMPIIEGILDRTIFDYRNTQLKRRYEQRSFSGIPMGSSEIKFDEIPLGIVATVQICFIMDERYCPGLHQNLILPNFEPRWESNDVRLFLKLQGMKWRINERLRTERTKRPFEEQQLSLSHV